MSHHFFTLVSQRLIANNASWFWPYVNVFRPDRLSHRFVFCVAVLLDGLLLFGYMRFVYVHHYNISSSIMYGDGRFSMDEGSFIELIGYFKLFLIITIVYFTLYHRHRLVYAGYALLFTLFLLDDSTELHERIGAQLAGTMTQDAGELFAFATVYLIPLFLIIAGYRRCRDRDDVLNAAAIGVGCASLIFCGVILDFVHARVLETYGRGDAILTLLEDGGELVSLTIILVIVMRVAQVVRNGGARQGLR